MNSDNRYNNSIINSQINFYKDIQLTYPFKNNVIQSNKFNLYNLIGDYYKNIKIKAQK